MPRKTPISKNNSTIKKRLFEETIEILDSDDDFDISKLLSSPSATSQSKVTENQKSFRLLQSKSKSPKSTSTSLKKGILSSLPNKKTAAICAAEGGTSKGIVESESTVGLDECCSNSELKVIDVEQEFSFCSQDYYNVDYTRTNNLSTATVCTEDSKDAWKGLMQRMQQNQKATTSTATGVKNSKSSSKGIKKAVTTFHKRTNYKVTVEGFSSSYKVYSGSNPAEDILSTGKTIQENVFLESPPKKLKLDLQKMDPKPEVEKEKEDEKASTSLSQIEPSKISSVIHPGAKIPAMFMKPEERAAMAVAEKLEKAKIKSDPSSVLSLLSEEPTTFSSAIETADQFNGNVVKLNEYVPAEDPYGGTKTKVCPFYKKLPGTRFSVDAFNYGLIPGIEVYFLSHFHSDHYIGLTKKFCKTLICSPPTANLVKMKLYVADKCIRKLQLNKTYIIDGVEIVLINANHCPGSVMFIFRLPNGITYFHTGDFRFTTDMLDNHFLQGLKIDCLYLDTTYCDPKYDFPTQSDAIAEVIGAVKRRIDFRPKTLIVCGSYVIGKERVYFSLAEAINSKVYVNADKRRVINALENLRYSAYLTDKEDLASIHVMQMFSIVPKFLSEYLATRGTMYTNIIGIKPSGWQFSSSGSGSTIRSHYNDTVTIIGVPYSEHSSFSELQHFVKAMKPNKVQPTVNVGSSVKRTAMMEHIEKWQY